MRVRTTSLSQSLLVVTLVIFSAGTAFAAGPSENTLYTFTGGADGAWPKASVMVGPDGALYGATQYGGAYTFGVIYKVVNSGGTWTQSVIYNFTDTNDGAGPIGPVTFDAAGNIYGTTAFGMHNGTVFKLSPNGDGSYSPTLLYTFSGGSDGQQPLTGVTFDKAGNLYGTTQLGGTGAGVLYELSPNADGTWTQRVIHAFGAFNGDGYLPSTGVLIDAAGNLYGATGEGGGTNGGGAVYEFSPNADGSWTENILYSLPGGAYGAAPDALVFDKAGNLYGTAGGGGVKGTTCAQGCGTIFRLAPSSSGTWSFTRIYAFTGTTGESPNGLVFDSAGNLYGTTLEGGTNFGVAFELKRGSTGQRWTYSTLYNFGQVAGDGIEPMGLVIKDHQLYGTTLSTTTCYLCGNVWQITP